MLAAKRTSAAPASSVGSCQKHLNFKGEKINPYWGLMCKAFGVTELGPFAVKGEGLKHPVGFYLGLTAFHSASAVPRLLRSQGS